MKDISKDLDRYYLDYTREVKVYKNLRKNCWSVKQDGLVKARPKFVAIDHAKFKVSEAGRQRVLASGVKNVHAYVVGSISLIYNVHFNWDELFDATALTKVIYNPFVHSTFITSSKGSVVRSHPKVLMDTDRGVFYVNRKGHKFFPNLYKEFTR